MNYIYDVFLNLNDTLYDFFDWNKSDRITHVKKIPIFIVKTNVLKEFINYNIEVEDELLFEIYNRTELWSVTNKIEYCALFSDNSTVIALQFNSNGKCIKKSSLLVDEELEILDNVRRFKEINIDYKIKNKVPQVLKTRKELKDDNFIEEELKNIENDKLKYIYFECFGKHEESEKIILNKLKKISRNSALYKNLYDILKLTSATKK